MLADGSPLGRGGQAEVIGVSNGEVEGALKRLHRSSEYAIARMKNEISALKDLARHQVEGVVELIDTDPNWHWYVMPRGESLAKSWQRDVTEEELFSRALGVVKEMLAALEQVHRHGYLHRDIKPENVLRIEGRHVLADFGVVHSSTFMPVTNDRAPGNRFAVIPQSTYATKKQIVDCIYVVHLWAWLLAKDPVRGSGAYHWAHHEFVSDARCEFIRGLLAEASRRESTILTSAASFSRYLSGHKGYLEDRAMTGTSDHVILAAQIRDEERLRVSQQLQREADVESELAAELGLIVPLVASLISAIHEEIDQLSKHIDGIAVTRPNSLDVGRLLKTAHGLALGKMGTPELQPVPLLVVKRKRVTLSLNLVVKRQPTKIALELKKGELIGLGRLADCTSTEDFEKFTGRVLTAFRTASSFVE